MLADCVVYERCVTMKFEIWKRELLKLVPKQQRYKLPDMNQLYLLWEQNKTPKQVADSLK